MKYKVLRQWNHLQHTFSYNLYGQDKGHPLENYRLVCENFPTVESIVDYLDYLNEPNKVVKEVEINE